MKKVASLRALVIAPMLLFAFAIPALFSAETQASPIDTAQIVSAEPAVEAASIYTATPISILQDTVDNSSAMENEAGTVAEEVIEETAKEPSDEALDATTDVEVEDTARSHCDYCGSTDHSYTYCAQRSVDNGAIGRWTIPSAGINVACYRANGYSVEDLPYQQSVVDAPDSAAVAQLIGFECISDHSNQSFSTLKYVNVGDEAYMDYGSYQQKYICTKFIYGHNNDDGYLTDADYNDIQEYSFNDGGITCYTCNGNWRNVIIVAFQPIS